MTGANKVKKFGSKMKTYVQVLGVNGSQNEVKGKTQKRRDNNTQKKIDQKEETNNNKKEISEMAETIKVLKQ